MSLPVMNVREAAAHFGVSDKTIRKWIKSGRLVSEMRPGATGMQYYVTGEVLDIAADSSSLEGVPSSSPSTLPLEHMLSSLLPSLVAELAHLQQAVATLTSRLEESPRLPPADFLPVNGYTPITVPRDWRPENVAASPPASLSQRRWWWPFTR